MLETTHIKDWLKTVNTELNLGIENFYVGKLDNTKEKGICIYSLKNSNPYVCNYLGEQDSVFDDILYISVLIHWNKSYSETEKISNKIFKYFKYLGDIKIDEYDINYFNLISGNEDVGTDEKGTYERVIQLEINYNI